MNAFAVLLAAGGGSRFAGQAHKLVADLRGRPLWRHSLEHVLASSLSHVVVVTGAVDLADPLRAIDERIVVAHNPHWASGQASSVHAGIEIARAGGADAVVIGLADQPFIEPSAWSAVAAAPVGCRIVVATYDGRRGPNPVRLSRDVWPLLPTDGDEGARGVLRANPAWVCEVPCLGSPADIDTLEDLSRWTNC